MFRDRLVCGCKDLKTTAVNAVFLPKQITCSLILQEVIDEATLSATMDKDDFTRRKNTLCAYVAK